MKKLLSILLSTLILFSTSIIFTFASSEIESDVTRTQSSGALQSFEARKDKLSINRTTQSMPLNTSEAATSKEIDDPEEYAGTSEPSAYNSDDCLDFFTIEAPKYATEDQQVYLIINKEDTFDRHTLLALLLLTEGKFYVKYFYTEHPNFAPNVIQCFLDSPGRKLDIFLEFYGLELEDLIFYDPNDLTKPIN